MVTYRVFIRSSDVDLQGAHTFFTNLPLYLQGVQTFLMLDRENAWSEECPDIIHFRLYGSHNLKDYISKDDPKRSQSAPEPWSTSILLQRHVKLLR